LEVLEISGNPTYILSRIKLVASKGFSLKAGQLQVKERARNNLSKFMLRQAQHERWWRLSCSSYFMHVPKPFVVSLSNHDRLKRSPFNRLSG